MKWGLVAICLALSGLWQGAVQAAAPGHMGVHRRVIVQVFAVFDGGALDFRNSFVDFVDGFPLLFAQLAAIGTLQMGAGGAQVG